MAKIELNLWYSDKDLKMMCVESESKEIYAVQYFGNFSEGNEYTITRMNQHGAYIDHMYIDRIGEIISMGVHSRKSGNYLLLNSMVYKSSTKAELKTIEMPYIKGVTLKGFRDGKVLNTYKSESSKMTFADFKKEALERLQQQFLATDNTKDTVMTRKNIIEMIKDLQTIN